jgi:hypothetical protein
LKPLIANTDLPVVRVKEDWLGRVSEKPYPVPGAKARL